MNETIAAIATPQGEAAISIVRLSGAKAYEIALLMSKRTHLKPRYAHLSKIYTQENELIDEAILLFFKAPHSFTGEDVVEFQSHGGFSVAFSLLEELLRYGVRLANAGEFSKRAYLNDKMSLLKALHISELIKAKSAFSAKLIARNLEGKLQSLLEQMRSDMLKSLAFVETSIDYADDDLPLTLLKDIQTMCEQNVQKLEQIASISKSKKGLIEGFKIAIIGKPNVGKSSLLNALLSYERALVSNTAGTTRDTIEESLKIGSHLAKIIDTAGIRNSSDTIEQMGIKLSKEALMKADIILAVFDNSRAFDTEDAEILELLKPFLSDESEKKVFLLLNKSDLEVKFHFPKDLSFIKLCTKEPLDELLKALELYLNSLESVEFVLPNLELVHSFEEASKALQRAKVLIEEHSLELFAFELHLALNEIAKYTQKIEHSEVLDAMFSNFCLGK